MSITYRESTIAGFVFSYLSLSKHFSWSRGYKRIPCSAQLSMKFFLLMNIEMLINIEFFPADKY